MARFQNWGAVSLGLNFMEAERVARVLGQSKVGDGADGLKSMAVYIRTQLNIGTVAVHRGDTAACATKLESELAPGSSAGDEQMRRGSGDAFNAGFCTAQLLDFPLSACLTTALGFRGYYEETGRGPSLSEVQGYIGRGALRASD